MARFAYLSLSALVIAVGVTAQEPVTPTPEELPSPPKKEEKKSHAREQVFLDPAARPSAVADEIKYAEQELKMRFLYADIWVNPDKYAQLLKDKTEARLAKVMEGELMLLVRRMLLVPSHLLSKISYVLEKTENGMRVSIQLVDKKTVLGSIDFDKDGHYLAKAWTDEGKKLLGPEFDKAKFDSNKAKWHAEFLQLLQNTQTDDDGKLQDEGQMEFLAKELFGMRNKFQELITQRKQGQVDFFTKDAREYVGSVYIRAGQDGKVYLESYASKQYPGQYPSQVPNQGRVIRK